MRTGFGCGGPLLLLSLGIYCVVNAGSWGVLMLVFCGGGGGRRLDLSDSLSFGLTFRFTLLQFKLLRNFISPLIVLA